MAEITEWRECGIHSKVEVSASAQVLEDVVVHVLEGSEVVVIGAIHDFAGEGVHFCVGQCQAAECRNECEDNAVVHHGVKRTAGPMQLGFTAANLANNSSGGDLGPRVEAGLLPIRPSHRSMI